jgi:hypothetical protein
MENHIMIQIRAQEVANAALLAYYHYGNPIFARRLDDALAKLDDVRKAGAEKATDDLNKAIDALLEDIQP